MVLFEADDEITFAERQCGPNYFTVWHTVKPEALASSATHMRWPTICARLPARIEDIRGDLQQRRIRASGRSLAGSPLLQWDPGNSLIRVEDSPDCWYANRAMQHRHHASEHVMRFEGRAAARVSRDLSFLRDLFDVLVDACRGATRLRITGRSEAKGPLPPWLARATEIEVYEHAGDSLGLHAVPLQDLFGSAGSDVFVSFHAQQTCLDLFEESLEHASHSYLDSPLYDASLIRTLTRLRRLFEHGVEKVEIINGRSFVIDPQTIEDLKGLDRRTPPDAQVTMTGELRFIDVQYRTLALKTAEDVEIRGTIEAALIEKLDIPRLLGRHVLIEGLARYRPSGRLHRVDVHRLELAGETASLRSKIRRLVEAGDIDAARRIVTASGVVREELGNWPDLLALPVARQVPPGEHDDFALNRAWIEAHREDYAGRWVALRNGLLKADAASLRELKEQLHAGDGSLDVFCARVDEQAPATK